MQLVVTSMRFSTLKPTFRPKLHFQFLLQEYPEIADINVNRANILP